MEKVNIAKHKMGCLEILSKKNQLFKNYLYTLLRFGKKLLYII